MYDGGGNKKRTVPFIIDIKELADRLDLEVSRGKDRVEPNPSAKAIEQGLKPDLKFGGECSACPLSLKRLRDAAPPEAGDPENSPSTEGGGDYI